MNFHAYLKFTRTEKNGIFVLVFLILFVMFTDLTIAFILPEKFPSIEIDSIPFTAENNFLASKNNLFISEKKSGEQGKNLFKFDPNNLPEKDGQLLGLSPKQINTIQHYVSKGGKFRKPEDLKKIWGIQSELAERLMPYVDIPTDFSEQKSAHPSYSKKPSKNKIIELNSADSATLESLPGIGPALAHRIIMYREKLGGFYERTQLKEVWGLNDTLFQKCTPLLKVDENLIRKINLNEVGLEALKKHPYFRYPVAKALIEYRNQHGFYKSLDDIQKIILIDEVMYKKIVHYLVIK